MVKEIKSVITCDLDGKVETFSEGAERLFGYKSNEVIGKLRVSDFSDGQVVLGHVVNWLKISVEKGEWEGDTVFLSKDKSEIPCRIKITPTKDKNGEHIGYCGVTTPLTNKTSDEVRPKISLMTKFFTWLVIFLLISIPLIYVFLSLAFSNAIARETLFGVKPINAIFSKTHSNHNFQRLKKF